MALFHTSLLLITTGAIHLWATGHDGDMFKVRYPAPFSIRRGFPKGWRPKDDLIAAARGEFYVPSLTTYSPTSGTRRSFQ